MLNVNYKKINGYIWFAGSKIVKKADGSDCIEPVEIKLPLYESNCLGACVERTKQEDKLIWFCNDLIHLKNMLGLKKGFNNCLDGWIKKVEIYKDFKPMFKGCGTATSITNAFNKAGIECSIIKR